MAEAKEYNWKYSLRKNNLPQDDPDAEPEYLAKVEKVNTLVARDIARRIVKKRSEYREDTIYGIILLLVDEIKEALAEGNNVNIEGLVSFLLMITGTFDKNGTLDTDENRCDVNAIVSSSLIDYLIRLVKLEYNNNVLEQGGAKITQVINNATDLANDQLTRGRTATIQGNKIKCVKDDGSKGVIKLYNESEEATEVAIETNNPSEVTFIVPDDLAEGVYRLEIETYYASGGTSLLKNLRTLTYDGLIIG